ncbi:MAG: 5-formyltetrahydrofolate cyclo-ligase [Muribaculaceae bacterium]|nr:5-formyltetrahydrofolate cyclo-ligase [Muribaculaceae bacterium]
MDKETIRIQVRAHKALLDASEKEAAAQRVFERLRSLAAFTMAENILLYHSLPDELSTHAFLECGHGSKTYYLPRVNGLDLEILPYRQTHTHLGAFRIEEPDGTDTVDIENIDLIVVPGIAFDRLGNRVGRGKGYYDRLLSRSRAVTVGVCYDFQMVDEIDTDGHDIPVDFVIADNIPLIRREKPRGTSK